MGIVGGSRVKTPEDLRRLDARLSRWWDEHGVWVDVAIIVFALAVVMWCTGFLAGESR